MSFKKFAIVIPARISSTRLPGKVLADINGKTMIERIVNVALNVKKAHVYIATDSIDVKKLIEKKTNAKAIMVKGKELHSGTDRVYKCLKKIDKKYEYIINLQGDMPNINEKVIYDVMKLIEKEKKADIGTVVYKCEKLINENYDSIVKCALSINKKSKYHRAVYFSRSIVPYHAKILYKHIGIYAYKFESLEKFVNLKLGNLESVEKLEQLRALENGMSIYATISEFDPISVDTPRDLEIARKLLK